LRYALAERRQNLSDRSYFSQDLKQVSTSSTTSSAISHQITNNNFPVHNALSSDFNEIHRELGGQPHQWQTSFGDLDASTRLDPTINRALYLETPSSTALQMQQHCDPFQSQQVNWMTPWDTLAEDAGQANECAQSTLAPSQTIHEELSSDTLFLDFPFPGTYG
jgi:hypothetical protein